MQPQLSTRFDKRAVAKMMQQLEAWIEQTDELIDNESNRDYPNQERLDMLDERSSALNNAKEALEEIS